MERYLTKTEKIAAFREKYLPVWVILPLISIFVLNCLIYWGSGVLTADRYHFDFTMSLDRAVPFNTTRFIWILYSGISFLGSELYSGCTERKRWILSVCGN